MPATLPIYADDRPWSKSSLSTLLDNCSWQWALSKVFDQPGWTTPANAVGTAYHAAVEHHERVRIVNLRAHSLNEGVSEDEMVEVARAAVDVEWREIPEHLPDLHGVSHEDAYDQVGNCIEAWWHHGLRDRKLRMRPLMVEPYLKVDHPASRRGVHGYVDWLGWDPDDRIWTVVDDKSSKNFSRFPHGGAGHETEAGVYLFAAMLATQLPVAGPVRMEWHVARRFTGQNANFERARVVVSELGYDEAQELLGETLRDADARADNLAVAQNPDSFLCSELWCPYFSACQGDESDGPDALTPERLLG